jgi:hypothetical protein
VIRPDKIKEIESYNNSDFLILSVYLGADSLQSPSEKFLLTQFHSLLHRYLNDDQHNIFEKNIRRIEEYLSDYIPSARSLVIFSGGEDLWEVVNLEFSLNPTISVSSSPNIDPILRARQKYSKYMVLLIDREKARMLTVEQGEIVEHSDFIGSYVPQNRKLTGREDTAGKNDIISRHNNEMLERHIEQACKAADEFARAKDINFLIIGGHAEMFAKVAEILPTDLKNKLAGSFITDVNLPLNEILIESKKVAANI